MQPILVIGLGQTGQSIARHLRRHARPFVVLDTRAAPPELARFKADFPDVPVWLETLPESVLQDVTTVITSPGVPLEHPVLCEARARGCRVSNDIEWFAEQVTAPVIAITGTNGKSTVTCWVGDMARCAGLSVAVAGNIGTPVLDCLDDGQLYALWVLELSSFQLEALNSLHPLVATVLNVSPDHLDRHGTLAAYRAAKQRVYRGASMACFNRDDVATRPDAEYASSVALNACSYGLDTPKPGEWGVVWDASGTGFLAHGTTQVLPLAALRVHGRHNWLNALAAAALATLAGLPQEAIVQSLSTFTGLPHRCAWVRTVRDVQWINDSKGTNVGATWSAIQGIGPTLAGKIVLIAGGQGKGADFTPLRESLTQWVRAVVLIGADADLLHTAWEGSTALTHAASLADAVAAAHAIAEPGDVVLLSPACASLDMFRDFNHRGEAFTALVQAL